MGQPTRGVRENVSNISSDDIRAFVDQYQVGSNLVVVATGDVNHTQIVDLTEEHFGSLKATAEKANSHQVLFTPSLVMIRDDEMANLNCGSFLKAPSYNHPDHFVMKYFVELLGTYRTDLHTGSNLNDPSRQYNTLHNELGMRPDIIMHKAFYMPFSDCGLIGSYIMGNEVFGPQIVFVTQNVLSEYSQIMNQAELFRARAKIFNDLLNRSSGVSTNREIANYITHLGRIVPRSEQAFRISSNADMDHLKRIATRWFFDEEVAVAAWGPCHNIAMYGHYNRTWKRSTLGWYGNAHITVH